MAPNTVISDNSAVAVSVGPKTTDIADPVAVPRPPVSAQAHLSGPDGDQFVLLVNCIPACLASQADGVFFLRF